MILFNGATKLYFMHYLRVVIILISTGLYKSIFSTYFFGKTRFLYSCVLVFHDSISLAFSVYIFLLSFEFNVILNNVRLNNILQFCSLFIFTNLYNLVLYKIAVLSEH